MNIKYNPKNVNMENVIKIKKEFGVLIDEKITDTIEFDVEADEDGKYTVDTFDLNEIYNHITDNTYDDTYTDADIYRAIEDIYEENYSEYLSEAKDRAEYQRDVYAYHGVSRRDFL